MLWSPWVASFACTMWLRYIKGEIMFIHYNLNRIDATLSRCYLMFILSCYSECSISNNNDYDLWLAENQRNRLKFGFWFVELENFENCIDIVFAFKLFEINWKFLEKYELICMIYCWCWWNLTEQSANFEIFAHSFFSHCEFQNRMLFEPQGSPQGLLENYYHILNPRARDFFFYFNVFKQIWLNAIE